MEVKEKYEQVTKWFSANMETAETELHYDSPFHLLIAVILSAQCTDKRVNIHTPQIFTRFPEPEEPMEEVEEIINEDPDNGKSDSDILDELTGQMKLF